MLDDDDDDSNGKVNDGDERNVDEHDDGDDDSAASCRLYVPLPHPIPSIHPSVPASTQHEYLLSLPDSRPPRNFFPLL